jgi:5'-AMP-activated protein kinase regulatory gamma subunit
MSTTVFDVVHMFSERGISAVPIIDENGVVVNLYETVDVIVSILRDDTPCILTRWLVQTLVRLGAYQSLDLTIAEALNQRSPDFPGVVICTASDSLGTLLQLIKKRRVHRLVVVEGEVCNHDVKVSWAYPLRIDISRRKKEKAEKKADCWGSLHFPTCCATLLAR